MRATWASWDWSQAASGAATSSGNERGSPDSGSGSSQSQHPPKSDFRGLTFSRRFAVRSCFSVMPSLAAAFAISFEFFAPVLR